MPGTLYQMTFLDPLGNALSETKSFLNASWAMRVNEVGSFTIPLPTDFVPRGLDADYMIRIERQVEGGNLYIEGNTLWFVQKFDKSLTAEGRVTTILAHDAKCLLNRRIVAYASGTSNAQASAVPADNAMKAIVRSNLGSTATVAARSWASTVPAISVQADTSQGATITKQFAWRTPITGVIKDIADFSAQSGTYLAFDMVVVPGGFEFRTYKGQRGTNRSLFGGFSPAAFGPQYGNLIDCKMTYDYTDYANYIYTGGQGDGSNRVIVEVSDAAGIAKYPFGRREYFQDARQTDNITSLTADGNACLREKRPRKIFTAKLVQTPATLYGRDYFLGDIITVSYEGEEFDCRIDAVAINLTNGVENIDIALQTVLD